MKKSVTKIEVVEEPEIQYLANAKLFEEIEAWLKDRGGIDKKQERDSAVYYDTTNYRLLREGIEYRVKEKGDKFRHDMKTPVDTNHREVVADENGVVWRNELKCKTTKRKPDLKAFFGESVLDPIGKRVRRFFDKELLPQFRSSFFKHKIDIETSCGMGRVEYSLQTGHMETMSGRKGRLLYILELELREGDEEALHREREAFITKFGQRGVSLLPDRKVVMGFELLSSSMTPKQFSAFTDARDRNRSTVPALQDRTQDKRLIRA